ncbi:MAG: SLBB domain-containing protein [Verrucomicrobia bacterium]|nr:SLBB domain-containing protein [Verrucomicrobiota bacterium]
MPTIHLLSLLIPLIAADPVVPAPVVESAQALPRAIASGAAHGPMTRLDDTQKLGIGDRISYRVIEDQDEPKSLIITDAGDIEVPYYGLARATDKTCKQLSDEVKVLLEKDLYYRATVVIALEAVNKTRGRGKVHVVGQVRSPGSQEIPVGEVYTVSKAILKSGGFSDFADKRKVKVVRNTGVAAESKTYIVNVADIWEKGQRENDIELQPEDLVFVPARLVNW